MKVGKGSLRVRRRLFFGAAAIFGLAIIVTTLHFISLNNIALAGLDERYIDVDKYAALNIDYYDPCWGGGKRGGDDGSKNCENVSGSDVTWVGDSYSAEGENGYKVITNALSGVDIYAMTSKIISGTASQDFTGSATEAVGDISSIGLSGNAGGLEIVDALKSHSKLRKYLVFALGTNASNSEKIKDLAEKAGDDVKIVVTTAHTGKGTDYSSTNKAIKEFAESNSNVALADWEEASKGHESEYFDSEGTHPSEAGYKVWVDTIVKALRSLGGNCGGGVLAGDNNYEKVWNAIVNMGVSGVSDSDEVIAGIIGNFANENGGNGTQDLSPLYNYGLWGESDTSGNTSDTYIQEKDPEVHKYISTSLSNDGIPSDIIDKAIKYRIEWLLDGDGKNNTNYKKFIDKVRENKPSGEDGVAEVAKWFDEIVEQSAGTAVSARQDNAKKIYKMVKNDKKITVPFPSDVSKSDQRVAVDDNLVATEPLTAGSIDGGSNNSNWEEATDYAGNKIFSKEQADKIKENQSFYQKSAEKYNIPWAIIAVIHLREHGLDRDNPDNGQGPYQFYSQGERDACTALNGATFSPGSLSDEEFQKHTDCVANFIIKNYGDSVDLSTDNGVKEMFFAYNGKADAYISQARDLGFSEEEANIGEGSPYVMNYADEKRDNRGKEGSGETPCWTQFTGDGVFGSECHAMIYNYGAFILYKALGGASLTSSSSSSGSNVCCPPNSGGGGGTNGASGEIGTLQNKIKEFAWDKFSGTANRKKEYDEAVSRAESVSDHGNDCGNFIGILMHESGWDTDYPWLSTSAQETYLSNSDKWANITNDIKSESDLMVGDVFVNDGHTFIFGDVSGFESKYVEASLANPSYAPQSGWNTWESTKGEYRIFRKSNIKTSSTATVLTTEKTTANGDSASKTTTSDPCGGGGGGSGGDGGSSVEGLSEEEANKVLADYSANYSLGSVSDFSQCFSLSIWWLYRYTTLDYKVYAESGHAAEFVHNLATKQGVPYGSEPKVYSIFSTSYSNGEGYNGALYEGEDYGHTGIVIGVNGDKVTVIEAWSALNGGQVSKEIDKSRFRNDQWSGYEFAYINDYMKTDELNKVIK